MSGPGSPEAFPGGQDLTVAGGDCTIFRLHPLVRRDVVSVAGFGALGFLAVALATMQAFPDLRDATSLAAVLALEAGGIAAAAGTGFWALGLAVRVDADGVRRYNLLFPDRPGLRISWEELVGAELRPWALSARGGYPSRRAVLLRKDGSELPLPPLDDPWGLVELVRTHARAEA